MRALTIFAIALFLSVFIYAVIKAGRSRISKQCDEMFISAAKNSPKDFLFNPDTAILLTKSDSFIKGRNDPQVNETNRIYKSSEGRYFLYIGTDLEPGILTPLSEQRAKNALRFDTAAFKKEFPGEGI